MSLSIKSYLRNQINIINIIIVSVLLTTFIIIDNLNYYFKDTYNNLYRNNSYVYTFHLNDISDNKIVNYNKNKIMDIGILDINYNELLLNENNKIIIQSSNNDDYKVHMTKFLYETYNYLLENEKITINNKEITDIEVSNYNYLEVPKNVFDSVEGQYIYILDLKDYSKIQDYNIGYTGDNKTNDTLLVIGNAIKITNILFVLINIILVIIYIIIIKEIIKTEYTNAYLERYLGFNNKLINKNLYIRVIITNIITIIAAILLSFIARIILTLFEVRLILKFDRFTILIVVTILVTFLMIMFKKGGDINENS